MSGVLEMQEYLRNLKAELEKSIEEEAIEPCEFSPETDRHAVFDGCDGYGNVYDELGGIKPFKCPCYLKHKDRQMGLKYMAAIPPNVTLAQANPKQGALAAALEEWDFRTPAVLMSGSSGSGKSFAAHYIACCLIKRLHIPAVYISAEDVADDLRLIAFTQGEEKEAVQERIARRMTVYQATDKILVLDDVGRERDSPAAKDEIRGIITSSYGNRRPLIITTNLNSREIRDGYGEHVLDRLLDREWCTPIKVVSSSIRRKEAVGSE